MSEAKSKTTKGVGSNAIVRASVSEADNRMEPTGSTAPVRARVADDKCRYAHGPCEPRYICSKVACPHRKLSSAASLGGDKQDQVVLP